MSVSKATFFHLYGLPINHYLWVVFDGFGKGLNAAKISREFKRRGSKVTTATIANILNMLRTILYESLKTTREQVKLGGPGLILEMDE